MKHSVFLKVELNIFSISLKIFKRFAKSLGFRSRRLIDYLRRTFRVCFPSGSAVKIACVEQFFPDQDGEYDLYQRFYENSLREKSFFKKINTNDTFAAHTTHVGQYLFRFRGGKVLKVAIDAHDHRAVRSQVIHDWSDIYFKSNRWPEFNYSSKVLAIPIGNAGVHLENCRYLRSLRNKSKKFDFIFVGRIWAGGGANVEHNLLLFDNLSKIGSNSRLMAVVFGFDQKSREFRNIVKRLNVAGVEWTDQQIGYGQLMELSAESHLVVMRSGVHCCIAWRMADMLGLGACIVMDQAPFPHWPVALVEGKNFLSLGLRITPECGPAPLEDYEKIINKMEAYLNNKPVHALIRKNNAQYFDEQLHPIKVGEYILANISQDMQVRSLQI